MPVRLRLLPYLVAAIAGVTALAQNGDRPDENQAPPPAHLVIPPAPVLAAEDALKTIKVAPGYRLEIEAADPLVGNPVAMSYGPDGKLWVVEMRAFMPNPDGKGEDAKVGAIVTLEDTDHDGRMDKRTVFQDGLVLPRALALVGDGVLVAEPPHLWFCRDRNGDGVADEKIEVASDYGTAANPEHTANGLLWAMDNWIYSANHSVRFRYLGDGKFARELTFSRGQWGITQDDLGRLFHNSNSDPLRYDAIPFSYFTRNPGITDPAGVNIQLVSADLRVWPARVTPGINRGYKSLDATGRMTAVTAACGPVIYRGDLMPELNGEAFIAEPSGNLVKRITLGVSGDSLAGHNGYDDAEFLASTDERFRPVNLANGPDGALHLVDMYKGIIQHRIYLTSYLRKQIEERGLAEGMGMGRIYRVVPEGKAVPRPVFNLAAESSIQLVARLTSPGGWWRDTAQRLLVERRDPAALPALRALAINQAQPAVARLHALWTLEGVEGLDLTTLLTTIGDPEPQVCAAAIRLSEKLLAAGDTEILEGVIRAHTAAGRPAPYAVILQQCLSLGESRDPAALDKLLALAREHGTRPLVAPAIVSGLAGREVDFLALALKQPDLGRALFTVTLAATCVWRSNDVALTTRLDELLGAGDSPAWAVGCLVESLKGYIPVQSDGKLLTAHLPSAPAALERLAAGNSPLRARAAELRAHLRWPGNEGPVVAVAPLTAEQQRIFDKGQVIFSTICAGCHQPNGQGLKGLAPSLVTSKWVAGDERAVARIVLHGKASEGFIMPPLQSLDDESLAGALTFVRRSWGHGFDPVAPETISRTRRETAGRTEPWSDKELTKALESKPELRDAN